MNIKFNKKGQIKFLSKYTVTYEHIRFIFPKGFTSDGASIPWLLRFIGTPFEGDTIYGALVHDILYGAKGHYKIGKEVFNMPRRNCDKMLRKLMRYHDVPEWKCWTYWLAVRLAGWLPWYFGKRNKKLVTCIIK